MTDISICIPVRNEAAELPKLFVALERLEAGASARVAVCLLLDGCVDASVGLAGDYCRRSRHAVRVAEVGSDTPNAGLARHRAMMMGVAAIGAGEGLLLTTDADSAPAPNWLVAMAAALREADVVAGRIVRAGNRPCPLQDRLEAYYDALFALRRRLDPVPWEAAATHHHAGGANIGMRAAAYAALGGFRAQASGEDAQLIDDAARAGLRVRRDAASLVHTSDRRQGRAPNGLSHGLLALDGGEVDAVRVAHPVDAAWQYRMQALARAAFAADRLHVVAPALALTRDHVRGVARDCPNAEAFAMRIVPEPPGGVRHVALTVAEGELAALVAERRAA